MLSAYACLIPLAAAILTLGLAIVVLRTGQHTEPARAFVFLATVLVFWNLNFFVLYSVSDHGLALSLTRVLRLGGLFAPPAIFHLALSLRPQRHPAWRKALLLDYGFTCAIVALNAFDLVVADLQRFTWGYHSVGTRFYNLLSVSVFGNFLGCFLLLGRDYYTNPEPRNRLQLKFWLFGAVVAFPLVLTNLLPAYGIRFYPLGSLGDTVFVAIVGYAIVRHRLMDIDIAVTKSMAYAAVALLLIGPAFILALWLQRLTFGRVDADFSFALLLMLIAIGLLFPNLRAHAEVRIERRLFREKHTYRMALTAFTRSIIRILDRERLIDELATTLRDTLQLDRAAIALMHQTEHTLIVRAQVGVPPLDSEIGGTSDFVTTLRRREQAVQRHELEDSADRAERITADICRRNGWDVCVPLALGERFLGFIGLGRKRNLDAFYAEDLELLETLAAEAAVALENARLYEELKKTREIIRRADRLSALGTLAAGIAHEVRNPLVSIQTFFQLAPQRLHDEEFFTTFLGMTANEVKRISDLITELLSFARSSTPSLGAVNLNELVDRVATLLEPEARKHKLTLTRALSPDVPLVNANGDQIKQVLINLVLNAIQATEPGGAISVTTRAVDHRQGAFGQLEIHDTGAGIPQDQVEHIFDPFFTTKAKGTGLGLAIAHQIVNEHGGSITVGSREGHGTSFYVNLPPYNAASRPTPPEAQSEMDILPLRYARARKVASS